MSAAELRTSVSNSGSTRGGEGVTLLSVNPSSEDDDPPTTLAPVGFSSSAAAAAAAAAAAQSRRRPSSGSSVKPQQQQPHNLHQSAEGTRKRRMVLMLLVALKILTSYDSGAFSVVLGADNGLATDLGLTTAQGGTLGSAVFLGNLAGCMIAGNMFSQYPAKMVFTLGMLAHAIFTFSFGFSNSFEYALIMRFLLGTTLAFPVVYSPIWVERFGPEDRSTTWMAFVNAGVPVGIMLGFVLGGLIPAHSDLDWRWIFYSKSVAMTPFLIIMHMMDSKYIDVETTSMMMDAHHHQQQQQFKIKEVPPSLVEGGSRDGGAGGWSSSSPTPPDLPTSPTTVHRPPQAMTATSLVGLLGKFSRNPLYVCNVMALCALYFVITALQTFVTPYLRSAPFNASMTTIVVGFGGTVVTAPVLGVIGGGVLIDRLGGYHENTALAMKVQAIWGFCCFLLSLITLYCSSVATFLASMWCLLAVGGAIVPVATGVLIASVAEEERPAASSISAMCFNLFGYFSGPLFCGMVADATGSLTWGIRVTLLCSALGIFPSTYAAIIARTTKLPAHVGSSSNSSSSEPPFTISGGPFTISGSCSRSGKEEEEEAKVKKASSESSSPLAVVSTR